MEEMKVSFDDLVLRSGVDGEVLDKVFSTNDISCSLLLKISKVLKYDFFRVYSHHLLLYSHLEMRFTRNDNVAYSIKKSKMLPSFTKNAYTPEIISFLIKKLVSNKMTKADIIQKYKIPKTTLYRWCNKYINDKMQKRI